MSLNSLHKHQQLAPVQLTHLLTRAIGLACLILVLIHLCLRPAQAAPAHWIRYATLASHQLEDRLSNGEEPEVALLQSWLENTQDFDGAVVVQIWISSNGQISKAEFPPLTRAQANEALHYLLLSTHLSEPPPADMQQPLRLRLSLGYPGTSTEK